MEVSPEIVEDVLLEYKRTRSPFRTAKQVGIDVAMVWKIIEDHTDRLGSHQERNGGYGRPELIKYIVGRKRITTREWDNNDPKIANARASYELGTVELCKGRDGGWEILYAIPRKKIQPRPNYFKPEVF